MNNNNLHESLRLFISNENYILISENSIKGESLKLDRINNNLTLIPESLTPTKFDSQLIIFGIFGIITLLKSDYLIVITKRKQVASILSTPIYTATDFAVYPIERSSSTSLLAESDEAYLLGLLKSHLFSAPFYFTYGSYNVTSRLQTQSKRDGPWYETSDERFFWNRHLQSRLIDSAPTQDFSRFILPVMFGFLNIKSASLNGRSVVFGLISRRSRYRAGTRYFSRGIDRDGNVSNFNETEQILLLNSTASEKSAPTGPVSDSIRFSYVQTRGSVPVFWAEINNLRYKPDLKIMDLTSTAESVAQHFKQQIELYGDQYVVNLVNKSGYERPVKESFEKAIDSLGNDRLHYTYFDFHHECKGLRFDRVSVLIDGLDDELHRQGYFYHDSSTSPTRPQLTQSSVVRTNCMDCLDRTNVVQSALGKWVLNNQLRQVGVLSANESIDEHPQFLNLFRNIWADNADVVSKGYSGTGALKTDYTRTGKRSTEGLIQDGLNSCIRYIKNNFLDGPRQDSYDLVTGAWTPRKGQEYNWRDERDAITRFAPFALLAAIFIFSLTIWLPELTAYLASPTKVLLLSLILAAAASLHMFNNGIDYVAWPRLVVLDETLNYAGKGFESGRRGRPIREHAVNNGRSSSKRESVLPQTSSAKRD